MRMTRTITAVFALACLALAADLLHFPDDFPGPPIYAGIGPGTDSFHTADWAMIPFYRDPDCVPEDFNLMGLFDNPGAFACPLTIEGFVIRDTPQPSPPIMAQFDGLPGMPIWFVSWPELQAGMADGVLTMVELRAMASLRTGVADSYYERFHAQGTSHPTTHVIVTDGSLTDGRSFQVQFVHGRGDVVGQEGIQIRIEFD